MEPVFIALLVGHGALALVLSGHALIHRPTPRSALLWILVQAALPFLGVILYVVFGIDRIHRRALLKGRTREELRRLYPGVPALAAARQIHQTRQGDPFSGLHAIAGRLSQRPLLKGNAFSLLRNGEETFPAMLADIDRAEQSVNLMTYIFDEDSAGEDFLDALGRAVSRGVAARLLYDAAGCVRTSAAFFTSARARGVRVEPFFPLNPLARRAQLNLRNHRKILVIDGMVGYFGSINISQRHMVNDPAVAEAASRDLHVRAEGPIVQQLQEVFIEDWYHAAGEELLSERHFPQLTATGEAISRVITGGPDEEYEHIHLLFFSAINAARESIQLVTPYFIPDPAIKFALKSAGLRGVDTEIYLPSKNDLPMIRRASFANLPPLVAAGVKVFEHPPPFVHAKACLIDGNWALMGSANMDARSFGLSYEVMVEMSCTPAVDALRGWIEAARDKAERITLAALRRRPLRSRLLDHFCNLFGPLL